MNVELLPTGFNDDDIIARNQTSKKINSKDRPLNSRNNQSQKSLGVHLHSGDAGMIGYNNRPYCADIFCSPGSDRRGYSSNSNINTPEKEWKDDLYTGEQRKRLQSARNHMRSGERLRPKSMVVTQQYPRGHEATTLVFQDCEKQSSSGVSSKHIDDYAAIRRRKLPQTSVSRNLLATPETMKRFSIHKKDPDQSDTMIPVFCNRLNIRFSQTTIIPERPLVDVDSLSIAPALAGRDSTTNMFSRPAASIVEKNRGRIRSTDIDSTFFGNEICMSNVGKSWNDEILAYKRFCRYIFTSRPSPKWADQLNRLWELNRVGYIEREWVMIRILESPSPERERNVDRVQQYLEHSLFCELNGTQELFLSVERVEELQEHESQLRDQLCQIEATREKRTKKVSELEGKLLELNVERRKQQRAILSMISHWEVSHNRVFKYRGFRYSHLVKLREEEAAKDMEQVYDNKVLRRLKHG